MITRSANRRTAGALLGVLLVASGCASSTISQATVPDTALSSEAAASATLSTAPSTEVTLTSPPTESPIPQASAGGVAVDAVAATSVDGLRVRSQPRVAGDSLKLEPLLPLGAPVFVLDGPVSASGYSWYEVAPLGSRTLPQGWVAAGSRTGEPWLAPGTFVCPPVPTDFKSLSALPHAVGLACFPGTPITVVARLIGCNCDIDGGWFTPEWFSSGTGGPEMLVEPQLTAPPPDVRDWFWLNLDPAGHRPTALPMGEIVEVTGVFDHPAAAGCTFTELEGEPVPSQQCRLAFAVGKLVAQP